MVEKSKGIEFSKIQSEKIRKDAKRAFLAIIALSVLFAMVTIFEGNSVGVFAMRVAAISTALLALATLDFYKRALESDFGWALDLLKLVVFIYIGFIVVQIPIY